MPDLPPRWCPFCGRPHSLQPYPRKAPPGQHRVKLLCTRCGMVMELRYTTRVFTAPAR